jgi:hypothetical protein
LVAERDENGAGGSLTSFAPTGQAILLNGCRVWCPGHDPVGTVRDNVPPIFDKLGVESRAQAIVGARLAGLGGAGRRG